MRSMFSNASFARYDLGAHALGQLKCPTGQAPMSENGRIICVPYSPPSGMFMPAGPSKSIAYGLAQTGMDAPYLTQQERDNLLLDIQSAVSKVKPIDALRNWGVANDPGLKKYLGPDASRFNTLAGVIIPLYPTVSDLANRLADTDGESWWRPSGQEMAEVKQWVVGVNEMYRIIQNHKASFTTAPGTQAPPSVELELPGEKGISTQNIVVGGAVAIGLGLLISIFA